MVKRLLQDQSGNIVFLGAVMMMVLLAGVGGAIDTGRAYIVRTRLSAALDAAGLAAGAVASTQDVQATAQKYFTVNYPAAYMNTTTPVVKAALSADRTQILLDATTTVPSTLMRIFGQSGMNLSAHSEITRTSRGMELVLVMDVTGSMNDNGKLDTLKQSAKDLLNILYGTNDKIDNLWVGLVPYSDIVNVGNSHASWLVANSLASKNYTPDPWTGCLDAEANPADTQDTPPPTLLRQPFFWADHNTYNNWIKTTSPRTYYSGIGPDLGPNRYCPKAIQPLTRSKATSIAYIDSMQARGNTHSNLGMVWGWRLLSPRWRSLWNGDDNATLPLDYNTPLMNKVVILLTDGMNTHSNEVRSGYGYLSDGTLGTTNSNTAITVLNNRLTTVCNNMRANNITVYTITLQLTDTGIQTVFRSCATSPDFYFNSPTNAELTTAFHTIADSLANLRISK